MAKGAAPEQQQGGGGDRAYDLLWLAGGIVISVLLLWYFEKIYIVKTIFLVRIFEIKAILYFFYGVEKLSLFTKLPIPIPPLQNLFDWLDFMNSNYGGAVDFPVIMKLSTDVGKYLLIPVSILLLSLGGVLFLGGSTSKFKNIFTMKQLKISEQKIWPQITPLLKTNLVEVPLDEKPWAVALDPMRFCKKNNLIRQETKDGKITVSLKNGAAYRVLSLQLGPKWQGPERLPSHLKALFAIFAARISSDKKSAEDLVNQIAKSAADIKPNFAGAEELLKKHINSKQVQKTISLHGYITTALASLLVAAREVGVLATSEFIWLKPLDRRMWYMLNSIGRPTTFAEVAGPYAHWLAEKKLGLPLLVPTVEEGVKGLEIAMKEILYKPEE